MKLIELRSRTQVSIVQLAEESPGLLIVVKFMRRFVEV
jgi:hypothetical protein